MRILQFRSLKGYVENRPFTLNDYIKHLLFLQQRIILDLVNNFDLGNVSAMLQTLVTDVLRL